MTRKTIIENIAGEEAFHWAYYLNRKYLNAIGIWPTDEKESTLRRLRIVLIFIIVLCGECLPALYGGIQVRHELPLLIDNSFTTIASWMALSKIFFLWYHRSVYQSLIKWASTDWQLRTKQWEREFMFKQARRGRLLTTVSCCIMFVHINGLLLAPVFGLPIRIVNNITDPNSHRILPVSTYYPYKYYESPYYEFTYFSQFIAVWLASATYTAVDDFFSVLVFHASGQCEIITVMMSRLYDVDDHRSIVDRLREIVDFHNYITRFVRTIEKSFNLVIFFHIFGLMLMACSVVYGFIKAFDGAPGVTQIFVLIAAIFNVNEHIFIHCLTAEILSSNSSEIFDGIYKAMWYNAPSSKEARCIALILAKSRRPLQLSAGNFFYLSLNSYVQIVKSTAGYISVLLTVN